MHPRTFRALILVAISLIVSAGAACAAEAPTPVFVPIRDADGHPDLSGVWQTLGSAHWNLEGHSASKGPVTNVLGALGGIPGGVSVIDGGTIPYRESALQRRADNLAQWAKLDPVVKCYIPGIPRSTYMPLPFQIVQSGNKIFIAYEWGSNSRVIHMDRPNTEAEIPSWMGYSLGRWEGDTLVVNVTAQMPDTWFDSAGNYHGENLVVTERYTLKDQSHIAYEATIEDPDVFTSPWTIRMPLYRRVEDNARILEFKCVEFAEDMMYGHLRRDAQAAELEDASKESRHKSGK